MNCPNCGKSANEMIAFGAHPRCQHRHGNQAFDPTAQCVLKSRHNGCHRAETPSGSVWTCA